MVIKRREALVLSNPLNKFSIPTRSLKTITGAFPVIEHMTNRAPLGMMIPSVGCPPFLAQKRHTTTDQNIKKTEFSTKQKTKKKKAAKNKQKEDQN